MKGKDNSSSIKFLFNSEGGIDVAIVGVCLATTKKAQQSGGRVGKSKGKNGWHTDEGIGEYMESGWQK